MKCGVVWCRGGWVGEWGEGGGVWLVWKEWCGIGWDVVEWRPS
jgi:hypothetical protein